MKVRISAALSLAGALVTIACDSIGQAMTAHTDVLARAASHELKVDKAASMIASNPSLPAQPDVVLAVGNLWIDYMLLAIAAAEDSTLRNVELDQMLDPVLEQDIIMQLRDQVVLSKVDTVFTDDELRTLFTQSGAGVEIRARHILLSLPPDATPTQRDSVTALARQLRERAASGGDFAALARQHSKDGSAQQGGDLGFFGRGSMVAPFEEAAFKLEPGQVSDVVETPYGLHIIKLEERKIPNFEEHKDSFRQEAAQQKIGEAETAYVKALTDSLTLEVQEGATDVVKDLSQRPETELRGRAANRALVKFKGGAFTAGDFVDFLRRVPAQNRAQIPQLPDDQLKNMLESLTRSRMLVREAERRNLVVPKIRIDSMKTQAWTQLAMAARTAGLVNIQPQAGESAEQAMERRVNALVEATIKGEQNVIPLREFSFPLRDQFGAEVFERAVPAVVAKVEAARPPAPPTPGMPGLPPTGTGAQPGTPPGQ